MIVKFIPSMQIKIFQNHKMIFLKENECAVVLKGTLSIFSHRNNLDVPQVLANYQKGDIVGFGEIDCGISRQIESWIHADSIVEFAVFPKNKFETLWFLQKSAKLRLQVELLSLCTLLKDVSEQTKYLILHELSQKHYLNENSLVYKQAKNSAFNIQTDAIFALGLARFVTKLTKGITWKEDRDLFNNENPDPIHDVSIRAVKKVKKHGHTSTLASEMMDKLKEITNSEQMWEKGGIFIILSGQCQVVHPKDGFKIYNLVSGDYFGEEELLRVMGCNYFGDITTKSRVKLLQIPPNNFDRIPEFDRQQMRKNCLGNKQRLFPLCLKCSNRYGGNPYDIFK